MFRWLPVGTCGDDYFEHWFSVWGSWGLGQQPRNRNTELGGRRCDRINCTTNF